MNLLVLSLPSQQVKLGRGGSTTAATFKMERFVIIVNGSR